jgi:hypothetical protein
MLLLWLGFASVGARGCPLPPADSPAGVRHSELVSYAIVWPQWTYVCVRSADDSSG